MADPNVFEFDTNPFMQGLNKIANGMEGLSKGAGNMAKNVSKGVTSAIAKIGVMALAFKGVKAAINEMPEIGQTFKIAKDVISKNLLFPLRKAVFPLLQRFLNWVRDNRAMFVKWGQTLANIFGVVVNSIGEMIAIGKKMFETFLGFVNKIFGSNIKDLQDLLNILAFKFAVVFEFLKAITKPLGELLEIIFEIGAELLNTVLGTLFKIGAELLKTTESGNSLFTIAKGLVEYFGKILNFVTKIAAAFVDGFLPSLAPITDSLQKIVEAWNSVFDAVFGTNEAMKGWEDIFKFLGEVVGGTLAVAFEAIATAVDLIAQGIKVIVDGVKWVINNASGIGDFFGDVGKNLLDFGSFINPFDDVIVTNEGKVVPVNSKDDIVAFKPGGPIDQAGGGGKAVTVNVDFKGMQIVLPEASQTEAQRVGETLVDSFRQTITREMERAGM